MEKIAKDLKVSVEDLIGNKEKISQIKLENYITEEIGILGLKDIVKELEKPGLEPSSFTTLRFIMPLPMVLPSVKVSKRT